jgi:integrase
MTYWYPALRELGLRPRKFYTTRSTYISLALTYGANLKAIAEHCGTSVAMIGRHYGRYLGALETDPLSAVRQPFRPPTTGTGFGHRRESSRN